MKHTQSVRQPVNTTDNRQKRLSQPHAGTRDGVYPPRQHVSSAGTLLSHHCWGSLRRGHAPNGGVLHSPKRSLPPPPHPSPFKRTWSVASAAPHPPVPSPLRAPPLPAAAPHGGHPAPAPLSRMPTRTRRPAPAGRTARVATQPTRGWCPGCAQRHYGEDEKG